ncbi:hypothetical protein HAZT_HAZT006472 [Hyalella azteca]|uniref:Dehydrogenase E1 component domain-containing protein n=1 Tax=Hyalella azteca TaxID=294128 RepID=A0A6A0H7W4_HYAAZ|nr:hypothetical protein HAZT_HAZT006472 [Hyalella azteca]
MRFLSPLWQDSTSATENLANKNGSSQPQKQQQRNSSTASEATFDTRPYKLHKLEEAPSSTATCSRDEALLYYRQMQIIRRIESAAGNLYKEKAVRGFCHLYSGQEAICVGMVGVLRPQDSIITAYRDHGWAYVMGCSVTSKLFH